MRRIKVTREQVDAARLELQALQAAGLRPDPLVRKLANATSDLPPTPRQVREAPSERVAKRIAGRQ